MAVPVEFPQQNNVLLAPEGNPDVLPLPVWCDGVKVVSCWRLSWRERWHALLYGQVYCAVLSGRSQPPVYISAERDFFRLKD